MEQKKTKKKTKWIKPRHRVIRTMVGPAISLYSKMVYGVTVHKFKEENKRQYLIISNHQTSFDQFFIGLSFRNHLYYIATEDIFSMGWVSKLINWLVAPIPFKKSTSDLNAIKTCMKVVKEGGSIALFPEGNRTYSGRTVYMKSSIASLVKMLKLPVAFYKIEGGYGVQPRWSDVCRRGKMQAGVTRVLEPEDYKDMSPEELFAIIEKELFVDETKTEGFYYHKKNAEYLERAMYVCPFCGLSEFESKGEMLTCKKCERKIKYLPNRQLQGEGFAFPYQYVADWYDYQCNFVRHLDMSLYETQPIYSDVVELYEVFVYKNKKKLADSICFSINNSAFTLENEAMQMTLGFDEIPAVSVLGKNKLNIYGNDRVFQIRGRKKGWNALKYLNLYYYGKNVLRGEQDGEFLGL